MHGLLVVPHRSLFCRLLSALDLVMGDSRLDRSLLLCLKAFFWAWLLVGESVTCCVSHGHLARPRLVTSFLVQLQEFSKIKIGDS